MAAIDSEIASIEEAKENYRAAVDLIRRNGPPTRSDVRGRLLLAEGLRGLGNTFALSSARRQAAPPLTEAIERFQSLVNDGLGGDRAVEGLCQALSHLAYVEQEEGKPAEAERLLREEIRLVSSRKSPGDRRRLAGAYRGLGAALMRITGRTPEALVAYREGVRLQRERMAASPGDPWAADELAVSLTQLAQLAIGRGDQAEARIWAEEALAAITPVSEANPRVATFAHTRSLSEYALAYSLSTLGFYRQARDHERQCARIMTRLVEENPTEPRYATPALAGPYLEIGYISRLMGEPDVALEGFGRSLAVQQAAVAKDPGNLIVNVNLAMVYRYRAPARAQAGDPEGGVADAERAAAILVPLVEKNPGVYTCAFELTQARIALADCLRQAGRSDAALHAYRDADALLATLLDRDANDVEVRAHRVTCHARRARLLAAAGQKDEASRLWDEGRKLAESPVRASPALFYARGVLHAVGASTTRPGNDEAKAAVEALRQAAEAGFRSVAVIDSDPDLAPLRGRDDYRKLLDDLKHDPPDEGHRRDTAEDAQAGDPALEHGPPRTRR